MRLKRCRPVPAIVECVAAAFMAFDAHATTLGTETLQLTIDESSGRITGVSLLDTSIADARVVSGFSYRVGRSGDWIPLAGLLVGSELRLAHNNLVLTAQITNTNQVISVDGRVTQSGSNVDLGIQLRFQLPVLANGWRFAQDPRRSEIISDITKRYTYEKAIRWNHTQRISVYPFIVLSPTTLPQGLCLAVPLDSPNMYRLSYQDGEGLFVEYDLGLHSAQESGPHADFSFVLFTSRADWGMRAALQRYYDLFPEFFTKRVPAEREGAWFFFLGEEAMNTDLSDFNLAFDEHGGRGWRWDTERDIYAMEYSEPWAYRDLWYPRNDPGQENVPTYEEKIAHLQAGLSSTVAKTRDGSLAAFTSGMVGADGLMLTDMSWWSDHNAWHVMFPTILHPYLADGMQDWMMEHEYHRWLADSEAAGAPLSGWYLDSVHFMGHYEDFSAAHFSLPGMRLSIAQELDSRASLMGWLGAYHYVEWFSNMLHEEGRILFGNGVFGTPDAAHTYFYPHFFDAIGIENCVKHYFTTGVPRPPEWVDGLALMRRAMMYRKPITALLKDKDTPEFNYKHAIFYGIHAAPQYAWGNLPLLDSIKPVAKKYNAILMKMVAAGWNPITHATSDPLWLERFGGEASGPLYIAVRTGNTAAVNATLVVDLGPLGLNGTLTSPARELTEQRDVAVELNGTTATLTTTVAAEDTQVFEFALAKSASCVEEAIEPCGLGLCAGNRTCEGGDWTACDGAGPTTEVCGNGFDDDCDREVDEGYDLNTDPNNCGTCGNVCENAICTQGRCAAFVGLVSGSGCGCSGGRREAVAIIFLMAFGLLASRRHRRTVTGRHDPPGQI